MKSAERIPKSLAYLNLGSPLNAISASPDGSKLIVAGRDTVKIVSLENDELKIETATNGAVVVWNITREGARSVERVWTDHNRAVNKLAWHPEKSEYLLTGSQDTTLKLSDIRDANPCKVTFQPKSEAIRDVQFHPFNPIQFAAAFDNGTVQLWDIRKSTQAVEKITAHQGLVLTIEWHPEDKNIIASGGRDRAIRVWDITSGKNAPLHNISTISSVSRVKWRPSHRHQIASCSSIVDLQTHIWDIKRPYIPIASFTEHRDVPTGLIWRDSQQLISCSKDNFLLLNSVAEDAYQPYHHVRTTSIGWNVYNELLTINDRINRNQNNENMVHTLAQYPSFFSSFNMPPPDRTPVQPTTKGDKSDKGMLYIHSPMGAPGSKDAKICDSSFLFEYFAKNYKFQEQQDATLLSSSQDEDTLLNDDDDAFFGILSAEAVTPLAPLPSRAPSPLDKSPFDRKIKAPIDESSSDIGDKTTKKAPIRAAKSTHHEDIFPALDIPAFDMHPILMEMLEHCIEKGDVQTCVFVVLILRDALKVDSLRISQWYGSYIELLHRFKMWPAANEIMKSCDDPAVSFMSQRSTSVLVSCACGKTLAPNNWVCEKCGTVPAECSVCRLPVKGINGSSRIMKLVQLVAHIFADQERKKHKPLLTHSIDIIITFLRINLSDFFDPITLHYTPLLQFQHPVPHSGKTTESPKPIVCGTK
eukprot:gene8691-10211_t